MYDSADARVTNLIYSILLDTDQSLWVGGGNGLVSKYDRDRKEFKTLSYEQLLAMRISIGCMRMKTETFGLEAMETVLSGWIEKSYVPSIIVKKSRIFPIT
ncbi:hypothetical protein NXX49_00520 [Candidatus Bacteroides intestinigallinarum]|nr:hypothetical protein [Candidatus Bacteroides intestinigallinarum]MCS3198803.1 hypothetical protein [Candidatus Bacteroides intestinigallinarum]